MSERTDGELLLEYGRTGTNAAFEELVHRHVDLVYATAFRVSRDANLAEDVTQRVFVALTRNARRLQHRTVLAGWLHETARNFAITTVRSEERRRRREQEAVTMGHLDPSEHDDAWDQVAPHLDRALRELSEPDRDVILLRFFERKTAREIGERLSISEEAAQKRADRALERLRAIFASRGVALSAAGLAGLLSVQTVQSAPVGLAASVIAASGTAGFLVPATSTLGLIMASTKVKIGLAVVLMAGVSAPLVIQHQAGSRLREELAVLRQRNAELDRRLLERPSPSSPLDGPGGQGRPQERDELLRLRAEVGSLRSQASNLASARSGTATANAPVTSGSEEPPVPAASWANVGLATPRTALQTLSWAKANRDAGTLVSALAWADEQTRASLETLFAAAPETVRAQHGSVEGFLLNVVAEPWVRSGSNRIVSYRVVAETTEGETSALEVEWGFEGGHTKTEPVRLIRVGEDWREPFDASGRALRRFADQLHVEGQVPAKPLEEP